MSAKLRIGRGDEFPAISPCGKGLVSWVLEEDAKRHPDAYWASNFRSPEELAAAQRVRPSKQLGSPVDWPV